MRPITGTISRSRSSRRSVRDTLRAHSRRSVKRGPGESLNIMERRTLRREELNQVSSNSHVLHSFEPGLLFIDLIHMSRVLAFLLLKVFCLTACSLILK